MLYKTAVSRSSSGVGCLHPFTSLVSFGCPRCLFIFFFFFPSSTVTYKTIYNKRYDYHAEQQSNHSADPSTTYHWNFIQVFVNLFAKNISLTYIQTCNSRLQGGAAAQVCLHLYVNHCNKSWINIIILILFMVIWKVLSDRL